PRARAEVGGGDVVRGPSGVGARSGKVARAAPAPDGAPRRWRGGPSHRAWSGAGRAPTEPRRRDLGPADGPARPRASEIRLRRPFGMVTRALLTLAMGVGGRPAIRLGPA